MTDIDFAKIITERASVRQSIQQFIDKKLKAKDISQEEKNEESKEAAKIRRRNRRLKKKKKASKFGLWLRRCYGLFWIGVIMKLRRPVLTLFETLIPVSVLLVFLLSISFRFNFELSGDAQIEFSKDAIDSSFTLGTTDYVLRDMFHKNDEICDKHGSKLGKVFFLYTPSNKFTDEIIKKVLGWLQVENEGYAVDDETTMVEIALSVYKKLLRSNRQSNSPKPFPVGLVFQIPPGKFENFTMDDLSQNAFTYKIRTFLKEIRNTREKFPYFVAVKREHDISPYIGSGFLAIQHALDSKFSELVRDRVLASNGPNVQYVKKFEVDSKNVRWNLRMFPYTIYLDIKTRHGIWFLLTFSIILGRFFSTFLVAKKIIEDKASGILQVLKYHGMTTSINWVSLLFHDVLTRLIQCILLVWVLYGSITLKTGFFEYESPVFLWIILYLHGFAQYTFLFCNSILFTKATFGACMSCCIEYFAFIIPMSIYVSGTKYGIVLNAFLCLIFPNWCLANALYTFLKFESYEASSFSIEYFAKFIDDEQYIIPGGVCMILLFLSTILYFALVIYLDHVLVKKLSPKESLLYCVKRNYNVIKDQDEDKDFVPPAVFEPSSFPIKIKCRRLSHYYNKINVALDNINMDIYEGEVTTILGNTGSGKSTLISCIGGITNPTSGYVRLHGKIISSSEYLRRNVGYSPQLHLFYKELNVEEHIRLCCILHGFDGNMAKKQSYALMVRFNLYQVREMGVKYISESQKRKLSLAMAISKNPKVLILDQPTSGMDIAESHEIWNMLRSLRKNRAIIVTANRMEEADLYSDRIAIMAHGKLLSFCSPNYLKQTLKIGSYLKVRRGEHGDLKAESIINCIKDSIGDSSIQIEQVFLKSFENYEGELYFSLPQNIDISRILFALEQNFLGLGFSKIGIAHSTLPAILHELALRAGVEKQEDSGIFVQKYQKDKERDEEVDVELGSSPNINIPIELPEMPLHLSKKPTYIGSLIALSIKHFLFVRQKHAYFWLEYVFPIIMTFLLVYFCKAFLTSSQPNAPLPLSINTYSPPKIPIRLNLPTVEAKEWVEGVRMTCGESSGGIKFFYDRIADEAGFVKQLEYVEGSLTHYKSQVVFGMTRDRNSYNGFYASNALHSAPSVQNFLANLNLYFYVADKGNREKSQYYIHAYNHPFKPNENVPIGTVSDTTNAVIGVIFSLILALVMGSKTSYPLVERTSGCKDIEMIAGITPTQYWGVTFFCDSIVNFFISFMLLATTYIADYASQHDELFRDTSSIATLFGIFVGHLCWASLPFCYIVSKLMSSEYSGYGQYVLIHIFAGIIPKLVIFLLLSGVPFEVKSFFEIICSFSPPYSASSVLIRYVRIILSNAFCVDSPKEALEACFRYEHLKDTVNFNVLSQELYFRSCCKKYCEKAGTCFKEYPFVVYTIGEGHLSVFESYCTMIFQGVFYWAVLMVMEYEFFQRFIEYMKLKIYGDIEQQKINLIREFRGDPSDEQIQTVQNEIDRIEDIVESGEFTDDILYCRNLTKITHRTPLLQNIYFGFRPSSIFGIMGVVNSGKTLLVKILGGLLRSTSGYVVLHSSVTLAKDKIGYERCIGYCTDQNAVLPHLTAFQMMQLMGRIRGIPSAYLNIHSKKWLNLLGFDEMKMNKVCSKYSEGMKRKLCIAMALIGNNEILIFDEPTKDLDILEHLNFWNIIQLVNKRGQSVIFTSINAQECVDNSNKLLVLEEGRASAFGTPQQIRDLYATGWTVIIRFRTSIFKSMSNDEISKKTEELKNYVNEVFCPVELKDEHENLLVYHVTVKHKTLAQMYQCMEIAHGDMNDFINDYFIEESSLDDIMGYFGEDEYGIAKMRLPTAASGTTLESNFSDLEILLADVHTSSKDLLFRKNSNLKSSSKLISGYLEKHSLTGPNSREKKSIGASGSREKKKSLKSETSITNKRSPRESTNQSKNKNTRPSSALNSLTPLNRPRQSSSQH